MPRPTAALLLTLALALHALPCAATHPLQTEDTGTQGQGGAEIENGFAWTRSSGQTAFVCQPQFTYGLTPGLDLIVQPAWLRQAGQQGVGDTNLDAKWRFWSEGAWSLGLRAGAVVATSRRGLGLQRGTAAPHATAIATWEAAPFTVHANLAVQRNPSSSGNRRNVRAASTALLWAASEQLLLAAEVGLGDAADPTQTQRARALLAGLVYTVRPGLDLDLGVQVSPGLRPTQRQVLLGLTSRFGP